MADRSQRGGASQRPLSYRERIKRYFSSSQRRLESSSASGSESEDDAQSDEIGDGDPQQEAPEAQGQEPLEFPVCQVDWEKEKQGNLSWLFE